jgi:hypothetical protein
MECLGERLVSYAQGLILGVVSESPDEAVDLAHALKLVQVGLSVLGSGHDGDGLAF